MAAGGGGRAKWSRLGHRPAALRPIRTYELKDRSRRAGRPKDLRRHDVDLAVAVLAEALDDVAEAVGAVDEQLMKCPQSALLRRGHKQAAGGGGERRGGTARDVSARELW